MPALKSASEKENYHPDSREKNYTRQREEARTDPKTKGNSVGEEQPDGSDKQYEGENKHQQAKRAQINQVWKQPLSHLPSCPRDLSNELLLLSGARPPR